VFWNVWPDREADAACRQEAFSIADKLVLAIAKIYENDGKQHIALEFENVYVNLLLLKKKTYAVGFRV
jgi:DNA polymerase elongation subunit (family B)